MSECPRRAVTLGCTPNSGAGSRGADPGSPRRRCRRATCVTGHRVTGRALFSKERWIPKRSVPHGASQTAPVARGVRHGHAGVAVRQLPTHDPGGSDGWRRPHDAASARTNRLGGCPAGITTGPGIDSAAPPAPPPRQPRRVERREPAAGVAPTAEFDVRELCERRWASAASSGLSRARGPRARRVARTDSASNIDIVAS
jgi:hypothetical protein